MYTVYTYWNSNSVVSVLNAIAMIMGGGDYLGLMRSLAIAGLFVAVGIGLTRISAKEPLQYFVFLGLFYFGLFVPKVQVDVVDVRTGGVGSVANVPLGVGLFYSVTSQVGHYLTNTFESNFQPVQNLRFGITGMGFGARAFQELGAARTSDPKLAEALKLFTQSCINPEVIDDPDKYKQLTNSTDVWATVTSTGWLNPGRFVSMPQQAAGGGYSYFACAAAAGVPSAVTELTTWITADVSAQLGYLGRRLFPDKLSPSSSWAPTAAAIAAALPEVEGYMLATSRTALDMVKQGMMVNAVNDSGGSLAVARNDPAAVQAALAGKLAEMQANGAYRTLGVIGEAALPKFRNVVELVIFSVFPIVMLLIVLAGDRGGAVLKTYLLTTIWVQLWAPLYAVVNFLMQDGTATRLQAALDGAASQTIQNSAALTMTAFKESSIAGALVLAVPVIAYALVRGGEVAMSGAMSGLLNTVSGAASKQGGEVGLGNVSVGNTSWGNHAANGMSANKWDTSGGFTEGTFTTRRGGFAVMGTSGTSGGGDYAVADASSMVANLGAVSASLGSMWQTALAKSINQNATLSASATASSIASMTSAMDHFKAGERGSERGSSVGHSSSTGWSSQVSSNFDHSLSAVGDTSKLTGLSDSQRFALTFGAGNDASARSSDLSKVGKTATGEDTAGFGLFKQALGSVLGNTVLSTALNAGAKGSTESVLQSAYQKLAKASDAQAFKDGLTALQNAAGTTSTDERSSVSSRNSEGVRLSLQEAQQSSQTATQAALRSEAAQRLLSTTQTGSAGVQANLANAVQAEMGVSGVRKLQDQPVAQQMSEVQAVVDSLVQTDVAKAAVQHGGATGPSETRFQQITGSTAAQTAGAAANDLAQSSSRPRAATLSAEGRVQVVSWRNARAGVVAAPDGSPSLPGQPGEAATTPGAVSQGAAAQRADVTVRIDAGKNTTRDAAAVPTERVTTEQNSAQSPGALAGRAGSIAVDTVAGAVTGRGGLPGGATVVGGAHPPPPPPTTPGAVDRIPKTSWPKDGTTTGAGRPE